ncbi:hypothetical protein F4825DRAFT_415837 [Nemania diffusa]|nr:hypothetical protein F4825DRAFT_415837 [Nemania diffusa]
MKALSSSFHKCSTLVFLVFFSCILQQLRVVAFSSSAWVATPLRLLRLTRASFFTPYIRSRFVNTPTPPSSSTPHTPLDSSASSCNAPVLRQSLDAFPSLSRDRPKQKVGRYQDRLTSDTPTYVRSGHAPLAVSRRP